MPDDSSPEHTCVLPFQGSRPVVLHEQQSRGTLANEPNRH
jgi:hypothetical protein